ncbi:MAG: hypothetical protein ACE5H4_11740 [Candidatus Thorarchaeota archaeon]
MSDEGSEGTTGRGGVLNQLQSLKLQVQCLIVLVVVFGLIQILTLLAIVFPPGFFPVLTLSLTLPVFILLAIFLKCIMSQDKRSE